MREDKGEIILYTTDDGQTALEVNIKDETVWLTQKQMSELFDKDVRTINEHIGNVYRERELTKKRTIRNFRIVQKEGNRDVTRAIDHYNLDVIISVGYRVKSKRGTQFRIWASTVLKEYLIKGYTINNKRFIDQNEKIQELQTTVNILSNIVDNKRLESDEALGLLKVIRDYTFALDLLDQYDYQRVEIKKVTLKKAKKITGSEARKAIRSYGEELMKNGADIGFFGKEKDNSFESSIESIYQTFSGQDLYPGLEEKAAHLLYFVIKNHSFVDGNKRIGEQHFSVIS